MLIGPKIGDLEVDPAAEVLHNDTMLGRRTLEL